MAATESHREAQSASERKARAHRHTVRWREKGRGNRHKSDHKAKEARSAIRSTKFIVDSGNSIITLTDSRSMSLSLSPESGRSREGTRAPVDGVRLTCICMRAHTYTRMLICEGNLQ